MADNTLDQQNDKRPGRIRNLAKAASDSIGEAVGAARDRVGETAATVMGATVEKTVTEYSELYTQVLLGVHRDLEGVQATVAGLTGRAETAAAEAAALRTEAARLQGRVEALERWRLLAVAALVLAFAALVGVLWIAVS